MYSLQGAPSFNASNKKKAFSFDLSPSPEQDEPSNADSYHVYSDDDDDDFIAPIYSDNDDYVNDNYKSKQQKFVIASSTKKSKKTKDKNDKKGKKKNKKIKKNEAHNAEHYDDDEEDDNDAYNKNKSVERNLYSEDAQRGRKDNEESEAQTVAKQNTKKGKAKCNSEKEKHKKRATSKNYNEYSEQDNTHSDDNDSYDDSDISSVQQEHISDVVMHNKQDKKSQAQDYTNATTDQSYESSYEDDFENEEAGTRSNASDDNKKNKKSDNAVDVQDDEYDDDFEQNSNDNNNDNDDDDDDYISSVHDSSVPSHEERAKLSAEREISSVSQEQRYEEEEHEEEENELVKKNNTQMSENHTEQKTTKVISVHENVTNKTLELESEMFSVNKSEKPSTTFKVNNKFKYDNDGDVVDTTTSKEGKENDKSVGVAVEQLMEEQRQEQHAIRKQLAQFLEEMKNLRNKQSEEHIDTKHLQHSVSSELNSPLTLDAIAAQVAKTVQAELSSIRINNISGNVHKNNNTNTSNDDNNNTIYVYKEKTELPNNSPMDMKETQTLFTRLAHDVREVFHELNLAVVAAEKERLLKDERYRSERAAREREEQLHKEEAVQSEVAERASRERAFWNALEQRESEFRRFMEESTAHSKTEEEARYKRELEERATRLRRFEELHTELLSAEREKLQQADNELRHRDNLLLQNQLEEIKIQYQRQLDELRKQVEEDRRLAQEQHNAELALMQTRHTSALEQLNRQHAESLAITETHSSNASKLEKMIQSVQDEVRSAQEMNATLLNERIRVMADKEKNVEEVKITLASMIDEMKHTQEDLHHERVRIATLYSQFEMALRELRRNGEDDRQTFKEAMMHYDTYREQAEKDHAHMLAHIAAERKALNEQRDEWLSTKLSSMNELQAERLAISQERTNAAMERERQNRSETQLLQKLHEREDTYKEKLIKLETELEQMETQKHEAAQWHETVQLERAALEQEREKFMQEKILLMEQFGEIKQRAEETSAYCERLQEEVAESRAMKRLEWPNDTAPMLLSSSSSQEAAAAAAKASSVHHAALYFLQGAHGGGSISNNNNNNNNNNIDDHSQVSNNDNMNVINQPTAVYHHVKFASAADAMSQREPAVKSSTLTHAATKFQIDLANQRAILERLSLM